MIIEESKTAVCERQRVIRKVDRDESKTSEISTIT